MSRAAAVLIGVWLLLIPVAQAADPAGSVERLVGDAIATRGGLSRTLAVDSDVFVGDQIATAGDTRLKLRMTDGSTITLGDHTRLTVDAHQAGTGGGSVFSIIEGVFLAVTSALSSNERTFSIRTPDAILGVRGTTFWAIQEPGHLAVLLLQGSGVVVESANGTVTLAEPEAGTDLFSGKPPSAPKRWGEKRIATAKSTVAFDVVPAR